MPPFLLLALGIAAATPSPETATERVKVISLDLKGSNVAPEDVSLLSGLLAVELGAYEALEVVSGAEVRQMIELEGEKQMLGCESSASCLGEIAGALGARLVAFGEVGRLGTRTVLNLSLHDSATNKNVGRASLQGDGVEQLADGVAEAVATLVEPFLLREKLSTTRTGRTRIVARDGAPEAGGSWLRPTAGVGAVVGVAAFAVLYASSASVPFLVPRASPRFRLTMLVPLAGPFLALGPVHAENDRIDDGFLNGESEDTLILVGLGVGQIAGVLAAVAGGATWALAAEE